MASDPTIQRILVALDSSPQSLAVLEAAAELAAALQAELAGLFVEDITLLQVAELPLTQQITFSGRLRDVGRDDIERQFRIQADQGRQALVTLAERLQVRWSFHITRGRVASVIMAEAHDSDLIALARRTGTLLAGRGLGTAAQALLAKGIPPVIALGGKARQDLPVAVLFGGDDASRSALVLANRLARQNGLGLIVLLPGSSPAATLELRATAEQQLAGHGSSTIHYWNLDPSKETALELRRVSAAATALILPGSSPLLPTHELDEILEQLEAPVLVVRQRASG